MSSVKEARKALEQRKAETTVGWAARHGEPGSRLVAIIVIILVLAGIAAITYLALSKPHAKAPPLPAFTPPADERHFAGIIAAAAQGYNASAADTDKQAALQHRAQALCAAFSSPHVSQWAGTINSLDAGGSTDGSQMITAISFAGPAAAQTAPQPHPVTILLLASAPLVPAPAQMKIGDSVIFSGNFFHDSTGKDCFMENIPSTDQAMQAPSFLMWFSTIQEARIPGK